MGAKNREQYVLGGERNAVKIEGFDFGNSPLEYSQDLVGGKTIVFTTSNGTRAIKGSEGAQTILIGAFLNGKAVADKLVELNQDVVIINAGTAGEFSMDDFICAGYILDCLVKKEGEVVLTDIAKTAYYVYQMNPNVLDFIKKATHYQRMISLGLEQDVVYCCQKDTTRLVPEYSLGKVKI